MKLRKTGKFWWGEYTLGLTDLRLMYHHGYYFDQRCYLSISPLFGSFHIKLPWKTSLKEDYNMPQYGFYYIENSLAFCFNKKVKHLDMPWCPTWVRTSYLSKLTTKESWVHEYKRFDQKFWDKEKWKDVLWSETHPYKYILKSGEIQNVQATLRVVERERRPKWLTWIKLFSNISRSIEIEFSSEIGEEIGSWKGGCIGCSWKLKPNQTPLEALKEMEATRKF